MKYCSDRLTKSLKSFEHDLLLLVAWGVSCLVATVLICWWFKSWPW